MEHASPSERAWICDQLGKKNAMCPDIARFCPARCEHQFRNCSEAEQYIELARKDDTVPIGEADAQIKPPAISEIHILKQADGTFKAEATVEWSLDTQKSTKTLPHWCWPNMTNAEAAALQQFLEALDAHEDGHLKVAADFAKEKSGPQFAVGTTEADAKNILIEKLRNNKDDLQRELDFRTKFYDDKTEHGGTQSKGPEYGLPGGSDVILTCP